MAELASPPTTSATPSLFEDHASQVIGRLRRAVSAVVESVPSKPERAVDLASAFGIDMKLAWRIGRVVGGEDLFDAARYVPGAGGFKIFLRAARRLDVSKGVLAAAEAAFGSFSELVHTHAGSRRAFDMMLAAHAHKDRGRADLEHRKQMFEGCSYVWGVQTRVQLRLDVIAPSSNPRMFDYATLRGFIDLRRLRPDVPWRISRGYSVDDAGDTRVNFERESLARPGSVAPAPDGLPLISEFCSKPLPECRRVETRGGVYEYELVEGSVGNTGILTCVMGELIRQAEPRYRDENFHLISQMLVVRTPIELAVFDVFIHREIFGRSIEPELETFSDLFADRFAPRYRECDRLPVEERVEYLGLGPKTIATPEVPRYNEMARFLFERCGWDPAQFDVYRVHMKFPPLPATVIIKHELPDAPIG